MIKKITRIDEKYQIIMSCYHMICYIQDLHYISIYIFIDVFNHGVTKYQNSCQYVIYIKRYIQNTITVLKITYIYV